MAWTIELESAAARDLEKIDRQISDRIGRYLRKRLSSAEDPRSLGSPLKGPSLRRLWRFRVGDYCIIARIEDETVTILVVRIVHRREVYRT